MKELDIFLTALENRLGFKHGRYVQREHTVPDEKFRAIKTKTLEVWFILGEYKQCISEVSITNRMVNDVEIKDVNKTILLKTYENILKWYGI